MEQPIFCRWDPHWNLQAALPPWAADYWKRRCRQQLRPWTLHYWKGSPISEVLAHEYYLGNHRPSSWPRPQAVRQLLWTPRIPHLPLLRWRNWIRIHLPPHGASFCRLRKEVQAGVLHLPSSPGLHSRCWALQLHPDHTHHPRTLWLCLHGRQRSHLWHLPSQPRRWTSQLH